MSDRLDPLWAIDEFSSVDFGDERLRERLFSTVIQLSENPEASISEACYDEASKDGAYRLFANDRVESLELLNAHRSQLRARVNGATRLFAIQDSTFFNFSHHRKTTGLGSIGRRTAKEPILGLIMHHTLILDDKKRAYGIAAQEIWAREPKSASPRSAQKARVKIAVTEKKESVKWINSCKQTEECFSGLKTNLVYFGDRENDIFEFLKYADENNLKYVIRNSFDRKVQGEVHLREVLANIPTVGERILKIKGPNQKVRQVRLGIKYKEVEIVTPLRHSEAKSKLIKDYFPVCVTALLAEELNTQKSTDAVSWTLLTNIPVNSLEDAIERQQWYKLRWAIEDFHRILKSGCKVEDCRLSTRERLEKFIVVKSVIAFKIMQLTFLSRSEPELPCTTVLTKREWQALYIRIKRTKKFPTNPPSLQQAAIWIAKLGGYKGRPQDPPPGNQVIWRGWEKLQEITHMMTILDGILKPKRCED
jgi:hypothetical protein